MHTYAADYFRQKIRKNDPHQSLQKRRKSTGAANQKGGRQHHNSSALMVSKSWALASWYSFVQRTLTAVLSWHMFGCNSAIDENIRSSAFGVSRPVICGIKYSFNSVKFYLMISITLAAGAGGSAMKTTKQPANQRSALPGDWFTVQCTSTKLTLSNMGTLQSRT